MTGTPTAACPAVVFRKLFEDEDEVHVLTEHVGPDQHGEHAQLKVAPGTREQAPFPLQVSPQPGPKLQGRDVRQVHTPVAQLQMP